MLPIRSAPVRADTALRTDSSAHGQRVELQSDRQIRAGRGDTGRVVAPNEGYSWGRRERWRGSEGTAAPDSRQDLPFINSWLVCFRIHTGTPQSPPAGSGKTGRLRPRSPRTPREGGRRHEGPYPGRWRWWAAAPVPTRPGTSPSC